MKWSFNSERNVALENVYEKNERPCLSYKVLSKSVMKCFPNKSVSTPSLLRPKKKRL